MFTFCVVCIIFMLAIPESSALLKLKFKGRPVRVRVSTEVVQPVTNPPTNGDSGDGWLLDKYMQLPAAQYACVPMPLNSSLTRVYGSEEEFILCVPKVSFNIPGGPIEVFPEVRAKVKVEPDQVVIYSDSCTIYGSPIVERLKLNDRFDFRVRATLTWKQEESDGKEALLQEQKDGTEPTLVKGDTICSSAEIEVDVYPPGRLALIPRRIIEPVGNTAMAFILSLLLEDFMVGLGSDYERWASDDAYRAERKLLEEELKTELHELRES
jgi:hypothetical protein